MKIPDATSIRLTKYIPAHHVEGLSEKQHAFLWLMNREALYGGAAGGGKSDALLMAALQYVDVPDYASIIFRRSFTDLSLPGAIMDRAADWLADTDARWSEVNKTWTFPSGATLTFGYLQHAADKYRYQSAEFQYIAFDELTQFPEEDYTYLFSRLRGPSAGWLARVPLRMRAATNPGGRGHAWVKERFIDTRGNPERVFIPASLYDNAHVDQRSYEESLSQLATHERLQLLTGDWDARPPGDWFFEHADIQAAVELGREYNRLYAQEAVEPAGGRLSICIDWGESTHGLNLWPLPQGGVWFPPGETVLSKSEPGESARRMLVSASRFGFPVHDARYDAAGIQPMRTFLRVARDTHPFLRSVKVPFNKYKAQSATYWRRLFERTGAGYDLKVCAISPENEELLRQLPELESDPENMSVWVKAEDQHGPDAGAAGLAPIAQKHGHLSVVQERAAA